MTAVELLTTLRNLDVKLWVEGDQLRCNAPKGVLTPALERELAECKSEVLDFLREATREADGGDPPIEPVRRDGMLRLSFAQERLWVLDRLEPENRGYTLAASRLLQGKIDVGVLERSVTAVIRRHEILRSSFPVVDGSPLQHVSDPEPCTIPVVDLRSLSESDRQSEVRRLIAEEAGRGFDLERGPLLRCTLLSLTDEAHLFLFTMHHIICDAWSLGVFLRELQAHYMAYSCGERPSLPELPFQYADYAQWQRKLLEGPRLERQRSYWTERLAGIPSVLELPTDRPRPASQSFEGAMLGFEWPEDLSAQLRELSRAEGVTLFMTLLTLLQILLYRYTDQEDIVVGTPMAHRNRPELEALIGIFVNTLVLRTTIGDDATGRSLLADVRRTVLDANANQEVPFEKLVEIVNPDRSMAHSPLFQVQFAHQNAPLSAAFDVHSSAAMYDLTLFTVEDAKAIRGAFQYNTDLFDRATIGRLIAHLRTVAESMVANPDELVSKLSVVPQPEQRKVLVEWNETSMELGRIKCLHEMFEEQVAREPQLEALIDGEKRLSYDELNRRANAVAHRLQALEVGPETLVGLFMERSAAMVVGLLGILKAGGAYVPLDPAYPKARIAFMLSDCEMAAIVTESALVERLPASDVSVLCLDGDREELAAESGENPAGGATPENLAYVIYTSGSTGKPKGVAIEHRSTVALLCWAHSVFDSEDLAGVLASTSICFDLSVFEMLTPLTCGGRVILAENALALPSLPAASDVTLVNTVPSAMAELLSREEPLPTSIRVVNLAGEPLTVALVRQIYEATSAARVYDLYGPSEDTTYSTWVLRASDGPYTIGRPVANTQAYILDQHRKPVPIGVGGELYLGGAGLARGYLNRPEFTAEKFVANPFSEDPNARLYRTGDLARYLPDGNIEFLGRIDQQVKLRGFRIELGEIESVLAEHPAVRDVAVVVRDNRLVAFVVYRTAEDLTVSEVRRFLGQSLPDYMVPALVVDMDALPMTPNGKVDRRALPNPFTDGVMRSREHVAPRTALEDVIAEVWQNLLGVEGVGIHDNFFELGGHSLLAIRAVFAIEKKLGVRLDPRAMFFQTLEQIAGSTLPAEPSVAART